MGDSGKNISEIKPQTPVCILLPVCIESKSDVFLNILQNVLARSKLGENYLDNALKIGMSDETFTIDIDDIQKNWKELITKSQQIRQSKLLGYWAVQNYPDLGKKLFGDSWQPHQRKCIHTVGMGTMKPKEIDDTIFRKMNLRIIELSVSQTTFPKLKYFIKVPNDVGKYNALKISPKKRSFDIKDEHLKFCWDALKIGNFSLFPPINGHIDSHVEGALDLSKSFPVLSVSSHEVDKYAANGEHSSQLSKRARIDDRTNNDDRADTFSESSIDSFRVVLLEMRKDIGKLTNRFDSAEDGHGNEESTVAERLDVSILKPKEELQKEIEQLKKKESSLSEQNEKNAGLISALQKGLEGNYKLHTRFEADLAASIDLIKTLKQTIAHSENEIRMLKSELRLTENETSEPESQKQLTEEELSTLKGQIENLNKNLMEKMAQAEKFDEELMGLKNYAATKENELEEANKKINGLNIYVASLVPEMKNQIENLDLNLIEKAAKIGKLEEELAAWKKYATDKENEVADANKMKKEKSDQNDKLNEQLNGLNKYVANLVPEMKNRIENLDQDSIEKAAKIGKLKEELAVWKKCSTNEENEVEEANKMNNEKTDESVKSNKQKNEIDDLELPDDNKISCEVFSSLQSFGRVDMAKEPVLTSKVENHDLSEMKDEPYKNKKKVVTSSQTMVYNLRPPTMPRWYKKK